MSEQIWLARLSEGWCPRPEHGRLNRESPSGSWCYDCRCSWFLRDRTIRATSYQEYRHRWDATLTEENATLVFSGIDLNRRVAEQVGADLLALARAGRDPVTGRWLVPPNALECAP